MGGYQKSYTSCIGRTIMIVRYVSELVAELIIMLVMMKVGKSLGKRRYRV